MTGRPERSNSDFFPLDSLRRFDIRPDHESLNALVVSSSDHHDIGTSHRGAHSCSSSGGCKLEVAC